MHKLYISVEMVSFTIGLLHFGVSRPCLDVVDAVRLLLQHTGLYTTSQRLTAAILCRVKLNTFQVVLLQNLDIVCTSETEILADFLVVLLHFLRNAVTLSLSLATTARLLFLYNLLFVNHPIIRGLKFSVTDGVI
jgi:hypothetical protein